MWWSSSWTWPKPVGEKKENPNTVYINDKIKAFEVIVIDEDDTNLGQMRRDQALRLAQEQWKDLVQLSYNPIDKVSTAKITDFGKYMYDKKRQNKEKKKTANKWMKQMKFAYGIGDNDLALKIKKVREMLDDGYTVRVVVQLKWRENIYKAKVIEKLIKTQESLADVARAQTPRPKEERNTFSIMLTPIKK